MLTINGRFLSQRVTGVQRYAREIVTEMDKLLQQSRFKGALPAKIVAPAASEIDPSWRAIAFKRTAGGGPLWDQLILPFASQGVLLSLCNMGPLVAANHIVCIHDVNILLAPESYSRAFRAYYRIIGPPLARRAVRVATVSSFSARMLSEFGLCRPEKVSVIPNGHEHVRRWRPSLSRYAATEAKRRPFVFVLGSRARHKNVAILLSIAKEIDELGLDILMAGAPCHTFSAIEAQPAPENVRFLGFVSDDDLAALYQTALCFAFPSLTEGFGLPALEALALGCPVIASNAASLPEVCGDAALYADPTSPRDWLDQIKRLQSEPDLAQSLRAKGPGQAKRFSWAKSAELYLDLVMALQGPAAGARN
ncbi:glycosyltransferase family 1 protein [Methylocapsa polymorpha]|uniref:Glycosyltransferase family 1 protein n=1 Tax=Methylocapsa polymorpha TaxID=3080828 RepID=A0ABZ0HU50_9HYPH|nr:glycosyltransferase family 1 protein [Methylocapsa sp. RX1]